MSDERDHCLIAVAILNPESVDRPTVYKTSAVVFRDYKVHWTRDQKEVVSYYYFRVRNYRVPVRFNGKNFQVTLREETYQQLFA